MVVKLKNYEELKAALVEIIRYLDCEAFFEEGACYTEEDIKDTLHGTVDEAMEEYYSK
jgi:putative component of membrane protein insertase Oxa1/YidC/SpoIIIJ protein YidD